MLLTPQRWKYRKQMVKKLSWVATRWSKVSFGDYALKAIESDFISNRQIEAARKVIVRYTKKVGKVWIRIFPDVPITKKGLEMPMGKGKGDVDQYVARVRRGRIMFELAWLDETTSLLALGSAAKKLGVKTTIIKRGEIR